MYLVFNLHMGEMARSCRRYGGQLRYCGLLIIIAQQSPSRVPRRRGEALGEKLQHATPTVGRALAA